MLKKRFREYFTFTRKERNGLFVLLIILFILILIRIYQGNIIKGEKIIFDKDFQSEVEAFEKSLTPKSKNSKSKKRVDKIKEDKWNIPDEFFTFDPNKISSSNLAKLGFSKKQIETLINYRNKGGAFYNKKDLMKIYGLDTIQYKALEPFILIENKNTFIEYNDTSKLNQKSELHIEINSSTKEQLMSIRGIGEVYANRIIKYRELLGGYYSKKQLLEVYGIDTVKYNSIYQQLTVDSSLILEININKADFSLLIRHPYFNKYQTQAILKYKKLVGDFAEIEQILENNLLTKDEYDRIKPYLKLN